MNNNLLSASQALCSRSKIPCFEGRCSSTPAPSKFLRGGCSLAVAPKRDEPPPRCIPSTSGVDTVADSGDRPTRSHLTRKLTAHMVGVQLATATIAPIPVRVKAVASTLPLHSCDAITACSAFGDQKPVICACPIPKASHRPHSWRSAVGVALLWSQPILNVIPKTRPRYCQLARCEAGRAPLKSI
eukprot:1969128-Pleurochrysis_carterae.AAC.1